MSEVVPGPEWIADVDGARRRVLRTIARGDRRCAAVARPDGGELHVDLDLLETEGGEARLRTSWAALEDERPRVVPLHTEEITVGTRTVERGRVRVHKRVTDETRTVEAPLVRERAVVERVPVGRFVDRPPEVRQVGDRLVVPAVEEVLVVEKRWLLREEVHVRLERTEHTERRDVRVRREHVEIERDGSEDRIHTGGEMARNLMGLYTDIGAAERLVNDLVGSGVPRDRISVVCRDQGRDIHRSFGLSPLPSDSRVLASGPLRDILARGSSGFAGGARTHDIAQALAGSGVPAHEARLYDQGLAMGHALVSVNVRNDDPDRIIDIMQRHSPLDIDKLGRATPGAAGIGAAGAAAAGLAGTGRERQDKPRPFGGKEQRFDRPEDRADPVGRREKSPFVRDRSGERLSGRDEGQRPFDETTRRTTTSEDERVIPLAREDVDVDKRTVERGGVRVRTFPVTEEVERDVRLRDETIDVDRRNVGDRPVDPSSDAFREQSFEVRERDEEPVIRKTAHVKEELHVGKHATERTERVRTQARHTEVEIERLTPGESARYEPRFRKHFGDRFQGDSYDRYRPAYEFGAALARSNGHRSWNEIEREARVRWESSQVGRDLPFDQARDCIRYGYEEGRPARV